MDCNSASGSFPGVRMHRSDAAITTPQSLPVRGVLGQCPLLQSAVRELCPWRPELASPGALQPLTVQTRGRRGLAFPLSFCLNLWAPNSMHSGRVQLPSQSCPFPRLAWQVCISPAIMLQKGVGSLLPPSISLASHKKTLCRAPSTKSLPEGEEICPHEQH